MSLEMKSMKIDGGTIIELLQCTPKKYWLCTMHSGEFVNFGLCSIRSEKITKIKRSMS